MFTKLCKLDLGAPDESLGHPRFHSFDFRTSPGGHVVWVSGDIEFGPEFGCCFLAPSALVDTFVANHICTFDVSCELSDCVFMCNL